jgi:hypothetical protein
VVFEANCLSTDLHRCLITYILQFKSSSKTTSSKDNYIHLHNGLNKSHSMKRITPHPKHPLDELQDSNDLLLFSSDKPDYNYSFIEGSATIWSLLSGFILVKTSSKLLLETITV